MKRTFKKYWGLFVPLFCGVLTLLLWGGGKLFSLTLQMNPFTDLMLLDLASVVVFLFWLMLRLCAHAKRKARKYSGVLIFLYAVLTLAASAALCYGGVVALALYSEPEHVVERNGEKMVAHVHNFLDVQVHYYTYENALYYGKELGKEDYSLGLYDPIEEENHELLRWEFHDREGKPLQSGETLTKKAEPFEGYRMTRDVDTAGHAYRFIYSAPYYWSGQPDIYSPTRIGITAFDKNMEAETGRVYLQNYLQNDKNESIEQADDAVISALLKEPCPDTAQAYIELLRRGFSQQAKENDWGETEIESPVFSVVQGEQEKMLCVRFDLIRNGEKQAVLQYIRQNEPYMLTAFFCDAEALETQKNACLWTLDSLKATKRNV